MCSYLNVDNLLQLFINIGHQFGFSQLPLSAFNPWKQCGLQGFEFCPLLERRLQPHHGILRFYLDDRSLFLQLS